MKSPLGRQLLHGLQLQLTLTFSPEVAPQLHVLLDK
jgi:hypothetical protein